MFTVEQVREMIGNKENVVGAQFTNARGASGTVLDSLSDHKKRQAQMTCTELVDGQPCTETHIREQSDWGQSYRCRTHSKTKVKSAGAGQGVGGGIKGEDGTVYRFQRVLETDDAETVSLKSANNAVFESLKAAQVAAEREAKEARAADRKAKLAAAKAERQSKLAADKKAKLAEQVAKMRQYADAHGIPISDVTLRQIKQAE